MKNSKKYLGMMFLSLFALGCEDTPESLMEDAYDAIKDQDAVAFMELFKDRDTGIKAASYHNMTAAYEVLEFFDMDDLWLDKRLVAVTESTRTNHYVVRVSPREALTRVLAEAKIDCSVEQDKCLSGGNVPVMRTCEYMECKIIEFTHEQ